MTLRINIGIMIFFDAKKIQRKLGRSARDIVLVLKAIIGTELPFSIKDRYYKYYNTDFSGTSYLLDPLSLVSFYYKYTNREIMEYVLLAARRNYGDYVTNKIASLDLFYSPVKEDILKNNRLLCIKDGKIHFYYEEDIKRRRLLWH